MTILTNQANIFVSIPVKRLSWNISESFQLSNENDLNRNV